MRISNCNSVAVKFPFFIGGSITLITDILMSPSSRADGSIRLLDGSTVHRIRSSMVVRSLAQCAVELVENALDANASTIKIFVHMEDSVLSVVDDGCGIDPDNFELLGRRYGIHQSDN